MELIERFRKKFIIDLNTQCWNWTATKGSKGYGIIIVKNQRKFAHRVAFELFFGSFNQKLLVCHTCDNTFCVNPNHLFLGTPKDNLSDCSTKKRLYNQKKTHCPQGHEYAGSNLFYKGKKRQCRTCARERLKRFRTFGKIV